MSGDSSKHDRGLAGVGRLRRRATAIARTAIDRYVQYSPLYTAASAPEHLHREGAHTIRVFVDTCLRSILDDSLDVHKAMRDVIERSTDRVAEGLPLRHYLRCWQIGFDVLAEALEQELGDDRDLFWPAFTTARATYDGIVCDIVGAYETHTREELAAQRDRQAHLIDQLLDGHAVSFDDPGSVPDRPVVALLDIAETPAERTGDEKARALAARRKTRGLRVQLGREVDGLWLTDLRPRYGRLLLYPVATDFDRVARELHRKCGALVSIAVAQAERIEDLPRAGEVAAQVLGIALRCGRAGTVSRIDDVALEHHLAHDSPSLRVLLARCHAMRERPDLTETLRSYFANDLDRRRTADALGVHPNTIDNRLSRVRELTGLDVRETAGLLSLAVTVNPGLDRSE